MPSPKRYNSAKMTPVQMLSSVLAAAGGVPGTIGGCRASDWLTAAITLAVDVKTGINHLIELDRSAYQRGTLAVGPVVFRLHPQSSQALDRIAGATGNGHLFGKPEPQQVNEQLDELLASAGLPKGRNVIASLARIVDLDDLGDDEVCPDCHRWYPSFDDGGRLIHVPHACYCSTCGELVLSDFEPHRCRPLAFRWWNGRPGSKAPVLSADPRAELVGEFNPFSTPAPQPPRGAVPIRRTLAGRPLPE